MKVTLGKAGQLKTWQEPFPETTECPKCRDESRIMFVAHEGIDKGDQKKDIKRVCNIRDNGGKNDLWWHDCCAVAVYACKKCFHVSAIGNQA